MIVFSIELFTRRVFGRENRYAQSAYSKNLLLQHLVYSQAFELDLMWVSGIGRKAIWLLLLAHLFGWYAPWGQFKIYFLRAAARLSLIVYS